MADYYPLIARAVAGLERSTGENRRVLYERARGALVTQLRSVEPPLDESDITHERLALEDAIRRIEAEAAKQAPKQAPQRTHAEPGAGAAPPHDDFAGFPPGASAHEERAAPLADQGLRGFREVIAEADGLGGAAAEANRAAREFYKSVPGARSAQETAQETANAALQDSLPESIYEPAPAHDAAAAGEPSPYPTESYDDRHAAPSGETYAEAERLEPHGAAAQHFAEPEAHEPHEAYVRPPRSYGRLIKIVLLLMIAVAAVGTVYWQRHTIVTMVASLRSRPAAAPPHETAPAARPKITDRVGGSTAPSPATAPAAAVAQKVVLYDEDPNNPQGKRYVGSAIWRTETVSPGSGLAPELAVRADVEIPERHMRMTWSLRRNTDKALPASHTIEIMFTLPADFSEGGIGNVPGVLMKTDEQARGVPLAGLAVKVTNGYFLIGLSAVDIDVQRNIDLLKNRDWFDIPIVYTNGKRAIMAVEKGTPGARAFEEAFRAWGE